MKWLPPFITLLVGLALGVLIRPNSEQISPQKQAAQADRSSNQSSMAASPTPTDRDSSPAETSTDSDVNTTADPENAGSITAEWLESFDSLSSFDQIGAIHKKLIEIEASEFPKLMEASLGNNMSPSSWQVVSMISARWAQIDPEGLRAYIETQPSEHQWGMRNALYENWAKQDPDAALAAVRELPRNQQRYIIGTIAGSMFLKSPQAALQVLDDYMENDPQNRWSYQNLFAIWGRRDPDAALAAAMAMENPAARSSALSGALRERIKEDPQWVLDWLDSQKQDTYLSETRRDLLYQLVQTDVEAVKGYVESVENTLKRNELLNQLQFHHMSETSDFETLEGLFDWFGTVATGQAYSNRIGQILQTMAQVDPTRAQEFVMQMHPGEARMNGISNIASQLAQTDPMAAIEFANSLEYEDERLRALQNMSWQLNQYDPEMARQFVLDSQDPMIEEQMVHGIVSQWSKYDREAALSWIDQLSSESAQQNGLNAVLNNWVMEDPSEAFNYIAGLETENNYARSAVQTLMYQDPVMGIEWLGTLDEDGLLGDDSNWMYRDAARRYLQMDPMAASEWIASLESGKNRDQAVHSLVDEIHRYDPEAGFEWAATIDDENQRKQTLRNSIESWIKTDPNAAYQAIKEAKVDASEKEDLFALIPKD